MVDGQVLSGKIPVGQTIAHAYSYLFKNFLTIVGIMWLPFVCIMGGAVLMAVASGSFHNAIVTVTSGGMGQAWYLILPYYLLAFVFVAMQADGITRHALGLKQGPIYFYFSLDKTVWRLLGAYLLFVLLAIAILAVFFIGAIMIGMAIAAATGVKPGAAAAPGAMGATATLGLVAIAIGAVAYCGFIYWAVRQAFLLTPVVVAEDRIGLGRSWKLGRGNFWRMLIIAIAAVAPIIVIELVLVFKFMMPGLPPTKAAGATPEQIAAWQADYLAHIKSIWYLLLPAYFLISTVLYGMLCSAQAFAYRSLVPSEKAEDVF